MPKLQPIELIPLGAYFKNSKRLNCVVLTCPLCQTNFVAEVAQVKAQRVKSCGCTKHGKTGSAEHWSWLGMRARCSNKNHIGYLYYGARGVAVCRQWLGSFAAFYRDMGPRPKGCTLERIDNNGDYCPENCRWATAPEQMRNNSATVNLSYRGKDMCLSDWAKQLGVKLSTLTYRIRSGWSVEDALTIKPNFSNRLRGKNATN